MSKAAFADFALDDQVGPKEPPRGEWQWNAYPVLDNFPYRIAVIGDYPDKDAWHQSKPFVGAAGNLISGMLSRVGVVRDACYVGYLSPTLEDDLVRFKPNICLLLGAGAFQWAHGAGSLDSFRGTLFMSKHNYKCVATWSPTDAWRLYDRTGYMWFDFVKAYRNSTTPILTLPKRNLQVSLSYEELLARLEETNRAEHLISVDIEGGINSMSCCSIARSAEDSYIIPLANIDASSYWPEEQEIEVWRAFARVLTNPAVPKVFQNGLYDRFVLAYSYAITVRGNIDDTMLKWAEKWCELEKGLGVQTSILTDEPYYKFERKSDTREAFYTYCCKDSAVTYEINTKLEPLLDEAQKKHYKLNISLLNPILYMELRGIRYDKQKAKLYLKEIQTHLYKLQAKLDALGKMGVTTATDKTTLAAKIVDTCCYKRDKTSFKAEFAEYETRLREIVQNPSPLNDEEVGFINTACKWSMNLKSPVFKTFLYHTLALPKQYDPKTKVLTTDYEALLKISKKSPHEAVTIALELGELRTRSQMLAITADEDARIRCGYNIVGTETGRITCYTSPTGSGYNLQTIPDSNALKAEKHPLRNGLRSLFTADEGYYMFQCDLSGADGWTVGAHLASLGDPTMLDDLRFGIKPAARICYMLRHGNSSLAGKARAEVKELLKEIGKEDWDYFACKGGIWGTCYTMGPRKLADHIFTQSEGKVNFSEAQAKLFQQAVFQVYNVHLWHRATERRLRQKPELVSPNGHRRRFFGRSTDILGQALAHEPQVNTTYATNLAAWRLWTDPQNRQKTLGANGSVQLSSTPTRLEGQILRTCRLRIEPLHQVHDALIGQFRHEDTAWAINRIKSYFNNEIVIANIPITIPFSGSYGLNWGDLNAGKI